MLLLVGCVGGSAVGYYFKVWLVTYLATLAGYVSYRDAALVSTATVSRLTLCLHEELLPLSSFLLIDLIPSSCLSPSLHWNCHSTSQRAGPWTHGPLNIKPTHMLRAPK